MIKDLYKQVEEMISSLNVQDAEGHIWWGKFKDLLDKFFAPCPACHGTGFIEGEDYFQGCCEHPLSNGECCGNGVPVMVINQCSYCGGELIIPIEHTKINEPMDI